MAKFASECIECMSSLIHNELIGSLGDETKDLKLRIGLHSGSVTAGVLRGDRYVQQIATKAQLLQHCFNVSNIVLILSTFLLYTIEHAFNSLGTR